MPTAGSREHERGSISSRTKVTNWALASIWGQDEFNLNSIHSIGMAW